MDITDGICYSIATWCDEPHAHFISSIQYFRNIALLLRFLLKKNFDIRSDIYRQSFKLDMMIGSIMLYTLIAVRMTWNFIQGHNSMRNQKLWCPIF